MALVLRKTSNRIADLVCALYHPKDEKARQTWPTATWAEIIPSELGIEVTEVSMEYVLGK